jgi:ribosomal protein S18 acetylase RimI-like enzyme
MRYKPVMEPVRIRVDGVATTADGALLWPVYRSVFGDHPTFPAWRDAVWERHRVRDGFRLARAYDHDRLVGFAYGYTGQPGQWWTDNARAVLAPEVADAWLGGHFELVSIGVLTDARGTGTGRRLIRAVLDGLPHERLLLMTTEDAADPARRLYAAEGWRVLGPGIGDATVIMGRRGAGAAADRPRILPA